MKNTPLMLILPLTVTMFALIGVFADAEQSASARIGLAGIAMAAICIGSRYTRSKFAGDLTLFILTAGVGLASMLGPVGCVWAVNALATATVLGTAYFTARDCWPTRV